MPAEEKAQRALPEWKVESLRVSAFTTHNCASDVDGWWAEVAGTPVETKTIKSQGALVNMEGALGAAKVILNCDLQRIDWVNVVDVKLDGEFTELPNFGPYSDHIGRFSSAMTRWLQLAAQIPITRLALGIVLVLPVADRIAGYNTLKTFLPSLKIDSEGSSELFYQINRARKSAVIDNLIINRLQKWHVPMIQRFGLQIAQGNMHRTLGAGYFGCKLDLDVNSSAEFEGEIPSALLSSLLNEFVSMGTEIATEGDIA